MTETRKGLFDEDEPDDRRDLHRRHDPETSKAAAYAVDLNALESATLDALRERPDGLTTVEIARIKGLDRDSVSPRMPRLVKYGLVVDSGEKRVPSGKRRAGIVWKAVQVETDGELTRAR